MEYHIGGTESGEPLVYFHCPVCSEEREALLESAGTPARCPKCGGMSEVPGMAERDATKNIGHRAESTDSGSKATKLPAPQPRRSGPASAADIDRLIEVIERHQASKAVERQTIRAVAWGIIYAQALFLPATIAIWLAIAIRGPGSLVFGFLAALYVLLLIGAAFRKGTD